MISLEAKLDILILLVEGMSSTKKQKELLDIIKNMKNESSGH